MNRVAKLVQHFTKSNVTQQATRRFCVSASGQDSGVLIEESSSGNYLVTLNRPKALNALNAAMINELTPFYQSLVDKKKPCIVVVKGAGGKSFCAGKYSPTVHFERKKNNKRKTRNFQKFPTTCPTFWRQTVEYSTRHVHLKDNCFFLILYVFFGW